MDRPLTDDGEQVTLASSVVSENPKWIEVRGVVLPPGDGV